MRLLPLLSAALLAYAPFASAQTKELIAYWDINGSFDRTAGSSGWMDAMFAHIGPGSLDFGEPGSELNLYGSSTAGKALEFYDLFTVVAIGHVVFSELDFRGYTTPEISFAYQKTVSNRFFEFFRLEYNIGHGWHHAAPIPEPTENYEVFRYAFTSGVLDGLHNVSLRLHFEEMIEINASLLLDNFQINAYAIPEPGSLALLGGAALLLAARGRRSGR